MKSAQHLFLAALLAASLTTAPAATLLNFDNVAPGSTANSSAPIGISFFNAQFIPDLDQYGDPILGSDKWQIDPLAPAVTVYNPQDRSYGLAPSPINALDAVDQPVLLLFDHPVNLSFFSVTLDNSTFGNLFNSPIQFYSRSGDTDTLLGGANASQWVPGFTTTFNGSLTDVSRILLPSGAFYDNISLIVVPEPGVLAIFALGAALTAYKGLRRKSLS